MPKIKTENNNTAITWRFTEEAKKILHGNNKLLYRFEKKNLLEMYHLVHDSSMRKITTIADFQGDVTLAGAAWELAAHFATNQEKVFVELYQAFKNGYGVKVNPVLADLILAVGVGFKDKKATELAEQIDLKISEDMEVVVLAVEILIGDIGNNLSYDMIYADALACLMKVDEVMKRELIDMNDGEQVESLIDCLADEKVHKSSSHMAFHYFEGDIELTGGDEVHKFQDTGLLGNASPLKSIFCCFCSSDAAAE